MCVHYLCDTHSPPPLGSLYVCGQGLVSGNLQSPTLVPELSVRRKLCPISTLDLIVFSQGAGPVVSFTSSDPVAIKAFSTEEW